MCKGRATMTVGAHSAFALPIDRYTGEPLRYVFAEGRPRLYSVGRDRDDDGGRPTDSPQDAQGPFGPSEDDSQQSQYDGDWILWPKPVVLKESTDPAPTISEPPPES